MNRREFSLTCAASLTLSAHSLAEEEKTLWNGGDLAGWHHAARGLWSVEDGAIVGRSNHDLPGPGYLLTEDEYQDFRLSLEFWISAGGNSGVYVREPKQEWGHRGDGRPAHGERRGYEIQVDYNDSKDFTGAVYGLKSPTRRVGRESAWNRMEIECRGPVIRVWVNDELVNEFADAKVQKGCIGLQVHGPRPHDHVVKFRNIRLSVL